MRRRSAKLIVALVSLILAATVAAAPNPDAFDSVGAAAARAKVEADATASTEKAHHKPLVILDVRTADEFRAAHLPGAKNVDFLSPDFNACLAALDKSQPYLLHCASGTRSAKVFESMKRLGFTRVTHLDGGFRGWIIAGGPVTAGTDPGKGK